MGCEISNGGILVFISGHCIPTSNYWLNELIQPLLTSQISYTYGRQIGNETSKFSETIIFQKYYPLNSKIPQNSFYCNNANAALLKSEWQNIKFDENLTGLEDMFLAKQLYLNGKKIGYVSSATVYHLHDESWKKIKIRFEREAIALQKIMPEIHITFLDFLRYTISSIIIDFTRALAINKLYKYFFEIIFYRTCQYWGSYIGNTRHRSLSKKSKENYFFPR
jgi:GT2 family glycosyltransferase